MRPGWTSGGLPKWLMRCDLAFDGSSASVTVHEGDTFVMRASLRAGGVSVPFGVRSTMPTWSRVDRGAQAGVLHARRLSGDLDAFDAVRQG